MRVEKKIELILSEEEIRTLLSAIDIIDEMVTLDEWELFSISNQIFDKGFCNEFRQKNFDFYDLKDILQYLCDRIVKEKE